MDENEVVETKPEGVQLRNTSEAKEVTLDGSVFIYRELDAEEEAAVLSKMVKPAGAGNKLNYQLGGIILKTVEAGLSGWRNVLDKNSKEIPFDKGLIKKLPKKIIQSLYDLIADKGLEEDEEKNS